MLPWYFELGCAEGFSLKTLRCFIYPIRYTGLTHLYIPYILHCLVQYRSAVIFPHGINGQRLNLTSTGQTFTN